jgi:hypothetical protein
VLISGASSVRAAEEGSHDPLIDLAGVGEADDGIVVPVDTHHASLPPQ